jgi:hypothetical protein
VHGSLSVIAFTAVALAGCAAPVGTVIVVGVMAADTYHYYTMGPDGKNPMRGAPPPDPTRTINAQDCTQPVDYSAGNLLCR